jgi:uncharacterized membrane protein
MAAHPNARLEAFCDGVFAIALTLLIIEIKPPSGEHIVTSGDLWRALGQMLPSLFAFVLSFGVILITWVNHHAMLKLIDKSSTAFVYANGVLLLAVVLMPFPTALLGQNLFTDHASPAVVLYAANGAFTGLGWALVGWAALSKTDPLTKNERATVHQRRGLNNAYGAMAFYTACAILAVWFPLAIAVLITVMWLYWVIFGLRTSAHED